MAKQPNFIDVHSHIQFPEYDADRAEVLARMREMNVATITVGTDLNSSQAAVELAEKEPDVYAAIGLHPHDNMDEAFDLDRYKALAQNPRTVAIGECGLDYSRLASESPQDREALIFRQFEIFSAQIKLANEVRKPFMLHIRPSQNSMDAYEDAYKVLKAAAKVKGNVHFFAGNWEIAEKFLSLGFTLSFTGVLTFARTYDEVIKKSPLGMILSETDCPFVAPAPYRGKRNEPSYVTFVADKIADIRGEDKQKVAQTLAENAARVFGLS